MKQLRMVFDGVSTRSGRRVLTSLLVLALAAALGSGCVVNDNSEDNNGELTDNNGNNSPDAGTVGDTGGGGTDVGSPADCPTFEETGGSINSAVTLDGCYDVTSNLDVDDGGHLTIMPGSVLRFAEGTDLSVWANGKLTVEGTADAGVLMTGASEIPGFWKGVMVKGTNSTDNILAHTVIEYAGAGEIHNTVSNANLQLGEGTRIAIRNTTLRHGASFGLSARDSTMIAEFTGNTLTDNAGGAGSIHANIMRSFDTTNTYQGNDSEFMHVRGGKFTEDAFISSIDVPFLIEGEINADAVTIEIEAGATLEFGAGTGIEIWDDARLKAMGSEGSPVTFRGHEATPGFWNGIMYFRSNGIDNELNYVIIEDSGNKELYHQSRDGSLQVIGSSQIAITNTTIQNGANHGLVATNDVNIREFANNTLTGNAAGPARVDSNLMDIFDSASTYTGNGEDFIFVDSVDITTDQNLALLDVPYLIEGVVEARSSTIEIEPGVTLTFGSSAGLEIWNDARLIAVGTDSEKITFTGEEPTPGYWRGVMFAASNGTDNAVEHAIIEYAGGARLHHNVEEASLQIGGPDPSQVALNDLEIANGDSFGIFISADDIVKGCNNIVFTSNTRADYHEDGVGCSP